MGSRKYFIAAQSAPSVKRGGEIRYPLTVSNLLRPNAIHYGNNSAL